MNQGIGNPEEIGVREKLSITANISDSHGFRLETLNEIGRLEDEAASCADEAQAIELRQRIQALRVRRSGEIAAVGAAGVGFSFSVALAGLVCGVLTPF